MAFKFEAFEADNKAPAEKLVSCIFKFLLLQIALCYILYFASLKVDVSVANIAEELAVTQTHIVVNYKRVYIQFCEVLIFLLASMKLVPNRLSIRNHEQQSNRGFAHVERGSKLMQPKRS